MWLECYSQTAKKVAHKIADREILIAGNVGDVAGKFECSCYSPANVAGKWCCYSVKSLWILKQKYCERFETNKISTYMLILSLDKRPRFEHFFQTVIGKKCWLALPIVLWDYILSVFLSACLIFTRILWPSCPKAKHVKPLTFLSSPSLLRN